MKPFYRKKGNYTDGRSRMVIVDKDKGKSISLPKPEVLWKMLTCAPANHALDVPKVHGSGVSNFKREETTEVSSPGE